MGDQNPAYMGIFYHFRCLFKRLITKMNWKVPSNSNRKLQNTYIKRKILLLTEAASKSIYRDIKRFTVAINIFTGQ